MSTWCRLFGTSHATTKALASASRSKDTEMKAKVVDELGRRFFGSQKAVGKIAAKANDFDRAVLIESLVKANHIHIIDNILHPGSIKTKTLIKIMVAGFSEEERSQLVHARSNGLLKVLLECTDCRPVASGALALLLSRTTPKTQYVVDGTRTDQEEIDAWYPHEPAGVPLARETGTIGHCEYSGIDVVHARQFLKGYEEPKAKEIMDALRTINPELWGRLTG